MDRLDAILSTVAPMMKRVDEMLSLTGAPPDHQVWPTLRRVRLLTWDAVQAVAALRPEELAGTVPELRADARAYADLAGSLPPPGEWAGEAAEAYETVRRRTADHLSGGLESLDERMEATADLADALSAWMRRARGDLAVTLAEVMTSSEGLALTSDVPPDPTATGDAVAAADVAALVLGTVADSYDAALELLTGSMELTEARRP